MGKTVEALLEDIQLIGAEQREIVDAVRTMIKSLVDPISEEVKYGGILFSSDVQFCGIFAYKEHVSLEFSHGAKINDDFGYLEGKGKGRRHIKLRTVEDIASKALASYLPLGLQASKAAGP